jgi:hypothetical protein
VAVKSFLIAPDIAQPQAGETGRWAAKNRHDVIVLVREITK